MKHRVKLLILFCVLIAAAYSFDRRLKDPVIITTDAGRVSGITNHEGDIHIFKGIPFAAPPVGDLRWKAPQPAKHWSGVRVCDKFGPSPMQNSPAPFSMWSEEFLIPKEPIDEDCLYLNVWTGGINAKQKRPVLVWIYGGGFMSGGSAVPIYNGEAMAKKGIVFVSINYRVGLFGFFAHPELTKESGKNASGNYGLMDQVAALQWIQKNIESFGGDPKNVTIAGQSAGSFAVNCLVASPLGKNLFQKAIGESGGNMVNSFPTLQDAEQRGVTLAQSLQANTLAALRALPAKEILKKTQGFGGPIIDGYVLPQTIAGIFAAKKENKVALLTGWNEDEGFIFGPLKNAGDFKKELASKYGAASATLLKFFPADNDSMAAASQTNLSRDLTFGAQNFAWANAQSENGATVYVYRFARKVPGTGQYAKYGAFHTGEVPYAYNNLQYVDRPWEPVDHELAKTMSSYWANFAATGNPNGTGLPEWPAYNKSGKMIMRLGVQQTSQKLPDAEELEYVLQQMNGK